MLFLLGCLAAFIMFVIKLAGVFIGSWWWIVAPFGIALGIKLFLELIVGNGIILGYNAVDALSSRKQDNDILKRMEEDLKQDKYKVLYFFSKVVDKVCFLCYLISNKEKL